MDNKEILKNKEEPVKHQNRREWVKNIIIVFLLIMLVLTFFSNTIMNYSLPEVSVTRMSRDKVSKAYSLSLTVEANRTYSVTAEENRDIKRVAVKRGQEVKEGQTLFFLEEVSESEEAKQLQEQIDLQKNEYEKALIKASADYFEFNLAVSQARDRLNQAIEAKNNAPSAPSQTPVNPSEISSLKHKRNVLASDLEYLSAGQYNSLSADRYSQISAEVEAFRKAEGEYNTADAECQKYLAVIQAAGAENGTKTLERKLEGLKLQLSQKNTELAAAIDETLKAALTKEIETLKNEVKYAEEDLNEVNTAIASLEKANSDKELKLSAKTEAEKALGKKVSDVTNEINSEIITVDSQLESIQSGGISEGTAGETVDYDAAIRAAQYELDSAVHALEAQMENDRVTDAQTQLDLEAQKKKIEDLEADMEKLLSKQSTKEIVSPVEGVVEEIKFSSGQSFMENDELMIINISDDGFTASATVTSEQAKSLTKGREAKVKNNDDRITVTVKNITKDKNDSSKFSVTFTVSGDVVAGQNLTVELGDSSSAFDRVVPRNAVKKDSSGSFVYVVKSKSTPLGNRYIVEKVPVTVIAEDDTQCAVSGEFGDSADYIITASSKPFNAGDQVRLSQE